MKVKFFLSALLFLWVISCYSQRLNWAYAGENCGSLTWDYSSIGKNNCLVVGGTSITNNGFTGIVSFNSKGLKNWDLKFNEASAIISGIACDTNGNTHLLIKVNEQNEDENGKPFAEIPEIFGEENFIEPGYHIVTLNETGNYIGSVLCDIWIECDIEVSEFKMHPNGNFILCGSADEGKISNSLSVKEGKRGGDFLLMLGSNGKSLWADAISYRENTCCAGSGYNCRMAISETGSIYIGGNYNVGAEFGNKTLKMAPTQYNSKHPPLESYVASYSNSGNLNWVTTSGCSGEFLCITANKSNVAIGFRPVGTNIVFGEKADFVNQENNIICLFDDKGKIIKTIAANGTVDDMNFNKNKELVVLGTNEQYNYKNINEKRGYFANASLEKWDNVFFATFDLKGRLKNFKPLYIPVATLNSPFRFSIGTDENFYLYASLFRRYGYNKELSTYDTAFKAGEWSGQSPFVGCVLSK